MRRDSMILSVIVLFLISIIPVYSQDVYEILDRSDAVIHPQNLQGSFTMTLTSRTGDTRETQVMAYQKHVSENRENRLFLFTYPPSVKGTGLLVHSYYDREEDRMWIYLPAVGKIKRVNLSTAGGGYFMGSDFTYSDLISAGREEFEHTLLADGQVDGEDCYVIRRAGKTRAIQRKYGYSRDEQFIRKSDYVPVRIVFYDLAGDLLKELSVKDVAVIGPYRYPSHVIMENKQTGHTSEILFRDIESPEDISDEYFTHRYLQNY
jgi:hypothetical protein